MYNKDIIAITEKWKRFYDGKGGSSLLQIRGISECEDDHNRKPLNQWNFETELEAYLDERARSAIRYWEKRADIEDMLIPSVTAWYGIAEHTAWLGGNVEFCVDTSYHHQILENPKSINMLQIDPDNIWFHRVAGGIAYLKERWGSQIYVKQRGADAPSDIANVVRGNDLFYDVYDEPEAVKCLASFCADGMRYYFSRQQQATGQVNGGYITGFDIWLPGNSVGQISEDASCMMSVDMYGELFLDALQKSVAGYDSVMMHTHSLGAHHLPTFASVPNISCIEISNDPNAERAIRVWRKYRDVLRDKIVIVAPTFEELKENADLLSQNRSIIWYYAKTKEEARAVCEFMKQFDE